MQQDAVDAKILEQATAESGAVVMGRRLFDVVNSPDGWNKDMGYGADLRGSLHGRAARSLHRTVRSGLAGLVQPDLGDVRAD